MKEIKAHISKLKSSDLVRVSGKNSFNVVLQFIIGVLKIKLVSVLLGPSGMTLFRQFNDLQVFFATISLGGTNNGITKLIATSKDSFRRTRFVISTSVILAIGFSFVISLGLLIGASFWSELLFHSSDYESIFQIASLYVVFIALSNVCLAVLKGQKNYNAFIKYNITVNLCLFLLLMPGAYYWGVKGAIWSQIIASVVLGLIAGRLLLKNKLKVVFSKMISKRLLSFSIMMLVAVIVAPLTQIVLRNISISHCSLGEAGLWDGMKWISMTYTSIITTSLGLYFHPRISELRTFDKVRTEVRSSLFIVVPLVAIGCLLIYLLRDVVITLLYSDEFSGMEPFFLFYCIGDVLKIMTWFYATVLLMRESVKAYIFNELILGLIIVILSYIFITSYGIIGAAYAYLACNFIALVLVYILYRLYSK